MSMTDDGYYFGHLNKLQSITFNVYGESMDIIISVI